MKPHRRTPSRVAVRTALLMFSAAAILFGFSSAQAAQMEPAPMNFVGDWPAEQDYESASLIANVRMAGYLSTDRTSTTEAIAQGSTHAAADQGDCVRWAVGRITAFWDASVNTLRSAWSRARFALFGHAR